MVDEPPFLIDSIIDILLNGGEHTIGEVFERTGIKLKKLIALLDFLQEFDFVKVNHKLGTVIIVSSAKLGFRKIRMLET
jgi:DNA-binding IclR family transcriptional regulator